MKNAVIYYSNTGNSKSIASYVASYLSYELIDIYDNNLFEYNNLVLVFPIHCQNIPIIVKTFFNKVKINKISILATYGKMSYGNVLYEIQKKYNFNIVSACYIPTKHAYIKDDIEFKEFEKLSFIKECFNKNENILIKKSFKNPFSNIFPILRSRIGVKIIKSKKCNNCDKCKNICQNKKCIRCLKCVHLCPSICLDFKTTFFMKMYLNKKKIDKLIIFK